MGDSVVLDKKSSNVKLITRPDIVNIGTRQRHMHRIMSSLCTLLC